MGQKVIDPDPTVVHVYVLYPPLFEYAGEPVVDAASA
jgi:hypothetical protein